VYISEVVVPWILKNLISIFKQLDGEPKFDGVKANDWFDEHDPVHRKQSV
jgi:hypothetical protein